MSQLRDLADLSDDYMDLSIEGVGRLANSPSYVDVFEDRQWRLIQAIHRAYYEAGYVKALDEVGRSALASLIERQRSFFERWMAQIRSGNMPTQSEMEYRASLYLESAGATYQRAATDRLGVPPLPAYGKDGTTDCLVGCACIWEGEQLPGEGNWHWYWMIRPAEHCFPSGTKISVPSGEVPIESIKAGDLVLTTQGPKRVTALFKHDHKGPLVTLSTKTKSVVSTPSHPFMSPDGWLAAESMSGKQALIYKMGFEDVEVHVALSGVVADRALPHSSTPHDGLSSQCTTVYNLEVENVHEYVANGFVVHNCEHCTQRAAVWNPLVILNGVIQPYNPIGLFRTGSLSRITRGSL